ncbi:MAG: DUF434 domain-containing protein [Verrucomicrobia bacterium]|nr:DUF434 domain-containing protein [Verrucomicrobiota bacterium]
MPHKVNHRGAGPEDERLFAPDTVPVLRAATSDLCWLLSRGYAAHSALELVGNRHALRDRQRLAVGRCACADLSLAGRAERCVEPAALRGQALWLDGYNVLMALEAALGGGVVLVGRDGCCRDLLGIHGSYHKVQETVPALGLVGELTRDWGVTACRWWLDRPVSNSGRLKTLILDVAAQHGWNWQCDLVMNPDAVLADSSDVVATADSAVLDRCRRWVNLARRAIDKRIPRARLVDLSEPLKNSP